MGDFQDTFGAGADAESVIDAINRLEQQSASDSPKKTKKLWFQNLTEAEQWSHDYPTAEFSRRPLLGGYQIETEPRGGIVSCNETENQVCVVFPNPDTIDEPQLERSSFMKLAENTENEAADFLRFLCRELPIGRDRIFPLRLTIDELDAAVVASRYGEDTSYESIYPISFCFDIERQKIIIFGGDHSALIGSVNSENEVSLEPWVFQIYHSSDTTHDNYYDTEQPCCFFCDQIGFEEGRPSYIADHYKEDSFDDLAYPTAQDLTDEIDFWQSVMHTSTQKLGTFSRPAALVEYGFDVDQTQRSQLQKQCQLIAASLVAKNSFKKEFKVEVRVPKHLFSQLRTEGFEFIVSDTVDELSAIMSDFLKTQESEIRLPMPCDLITGFPHNEQCLRVKSKAAGRTFAPHLSKTKYDIIRASIKPENLTIGQREIATIALKRLEFADDICDVLEELIVSRRRQKLRAQQKLRHD